MTGYNLQLRYYDRPPNTAGWVWRITDTNHIPKRDSPLGALYDTRAAAVEAGQQALMELMATDQLGVDDPTRWHTINPEPAEPNPSVGGWLFDEAVVAANPADDILADILRKAIKDKGPVDIDPEPLIEPPEPGTRTMTKFMIAFHIAYIAAAITAGFHIGWLATALFLAILAWSGAPLLRSPHR